MLKSKWVMRASILIAPYLFLLRHGKHNTTRCRTTENGSIKTIQALLDFGADPNLPDTMGVTPLMVAAACGDCQSVGSLISAGCDVSMTCEQGFTAYEFAVAAGNEDAAELIAEVSMP